MANATEKLTAYIPLDRRHALASGQPLPERVQGTAIFADIDGFTALTERLVQELGPQRGAEELTVHLNRVYDAVIDVLHAYGASVIAFAGDAVTSWVDADDGRRAITCALAIREAMAPFDRVDTPGGGYASLSIKIVIATGTARRFQVGDPGIRLLDALAGETLVRLAAAETMAGKGEIIVEGRTLAGLHDLVEVAEYRNDPASDRSCGVVRSLRMIDFPSPSPEATDFPLDSAHVRPWLHAPVYARLQSGLGDFLAELRPTVALFVRFSGIDYDGDNAAGDKLDRYIRWVQQVAARYEGTLIDLNIGDKGSYLYLNFGALLAHEDSSARALAAALELRRGSDDLSFIDPVQIGISRGRMRVGAYGGSAHRTYGALGSEVNMAARLMMAAEPGQVLVSQTVRYRRDGLFIFRLEPPLHLKGRQDPVKAFSLMDVQPIRGVGAVSNMDVGPMVGRRHEIGAIEAILDLALDGAGQIIGIRGEAGVGKSRLMAELLRLAGDRNFTVVGGECQSYGVNSNYLVWQSIWHALLRIDANWDAARKIQAIRSRLASIDPGLEVRHPLVSVLFNIEISDTELTAALDAKTKKAALESLLIDCLTAEARRRPLVILLEDCHWLDSLSQDLIDAVANAIVDLPIVIVMAFRPPEMERLHRTLGSALDHYSELELSVFSAGETEEHIGHVLAQIYKERKAVSRPLVDGILTKAEGNPFYIVELLTYMRDQGFDPDKIADIGALALPDSLSTLVLSRVDRLPEYQVSLLKVASVLGRTFDAAWLCEVHDSLGSREDVQQSLGLLTAQGFVALDPVATDASHLFCQTIVQNAVYESVPHNVRSQVHERVGQFIEASMSAALEQYLDRLAYHYDRSDNMDKKAEYLWKAGVAAQNNYANEAAIDYFQRLLPIVDGAKVVEVHLRLGRLFELVGRWEDASERYQAALSTAGVVGDVANEIRSQRAMGRLLYHEKPQEALRWLYEGLTLARTLNSTEVDISEAAFLVDIGWANVQMGDLDLAMDALLAGLAGLPDAPSAIRGNALSSLSGIFRRNMNAEQALAYAELAVENSRAIPDLAQEQMAQINLAAVYYYLLHDWGRAVAQLEEVTEIAHRIGDRRAQAALEVNLGSTYLKLGDADSADFHLKNGIALCRQSRLYEYEYEARTALVELYVRCSDPDGAGVQLDETRALVETLGSADKSAKIERLTAECSLAAGRRQAALLQASGAVQQAVGCGDSKEAAICRRVLGKVHLAINDPVQAEAELAESEAMLRDLDSYEAARSRFYLGRALLALGRTAEGEAVVDETRRFFEQVDAGFDIAEIMALMHNTEPPNRIR